MAPVGDTSVLRKQMGFICLMACVVAIRRREKRRMEESNRRMGRPWDGWNGGLARLLSLWWESCGWKIPDPVAFVTTYGCRTHFLTNCVG